MEVVKPNIAGISMLIMKLMKNAIGFHNPSIESIPGLNPKTFIASLNEMSSTNITTIKYATSHLTGHISNHISTERPLGIPKIKATTPLIMKLIKKVIGFHKFINFSSTIT